MSSSPIHRCQTPHEVFQVIAEAKAKMIPVVPLIGAGLSLEAGVPTTPHMIEYMSKVQFLLDLHHRRDGEDLDYAEPLEIEGWPDPGWINDLLLDALRDRRGLDPRPSWFRDYEALESHFLGWGGDRLEAVRLFTLHQYLSQVQPSVLKIVSDFGRCPVMGAFAGEVGRILDQVTAGRARLEPGEETRLLNGLKGLMKENGMRDQVLQNLSQDWRGMLRFLTSGIPGLVQLVLPAAAARPPPLDRAPVPGADGRVPRLAAVADHELRRPDREGAARPADRDRGVRAARQRPGARLPAVPRPAVGRQAARQRLRAARRREPRHPAGPDEPRDARRIPGERRDRPRPRLRRRRPPRHEPDRGHNPYTRI